MKKNKFKSIKDDTSNYSVSYSPKPKTSKTCYFYLYHVGTADSDILKMFEFDFNYSWKFNNCNHFTMGIIEFYNQTLKTQDKEYTKLKLPHISLSYNIIMKALDLTKPGQAVSYLLPAALSTILYFSTMPKEILSSVVSDVFSKELPTIHNPLIKYIKSKTHSITYDELLKRYESEKQQFFSFF